MKNIESSLDKLRTKSKILVLIDSNAIIHRAYNALPKTMSTRKGEQTNAVYGFATTLIKILEDLHPEYVVASFDVSKATFRTEKYAAYKATRVKADQELYDQIPRVKELLSAFNIPIYEKEGYEADDCIGTIVSKITNLKLQITNKLQIQNLPAGRQGLNAQNNEAIEQYDNPPTGEAGNTESGSQIPPIRRAGKSGMTNSEDLSIYIVTGDKDLFQLVNGNIFVYSLRKGLSQMAVVDRKVIKDEYNLDPEDFIDLKALAGDASDNIPGVPGIGPKGATDLLQRFDTLKNLYEEIEAVIPAKAGIQKNTILDPRVKPEDNKMEKDDGGLIEAAKKLDIKPRILQLLVEYKEQAFLSQDLATINKDVPIEFDLKEAKWGEYDREKVKQLFEELGFHSLLRRFGAEISPEKKTEKAKDQAKKDKQLKLL